MLHGVTKQLSQLLSVVSCVHRYSTGLGLSGSDALIQDFYSGECTNPIHLILDTQLTDGRMAIRAFVSRTLTLRKHQVGALGTDASQMAAAWHGILATIQPPQETATSQLCCQCRSRRLRQSSWRCRAK